jgi:hypothetical protein
VIGKWPDKTEDIRTKSTTTETILQTVSRFKDWISRVIELSRMLSICIDQNVNAWQKFMDGDAYYFYPGHASTNILDVSRKSILTTNAAFNELRSMQEELQHLMEELTKDIPRDVRF